MKSLADSSKCFFFYFLLSRQRLTAAIAALGRLMKLPLRSKISIRLWQMPKLNGKKPTQTMFMCSKHNHIQRCRLLCRKVAGFFFGTVNSLTFTFRKFCKQTFCVISSVRIKYKRHMHSHLGII